ncbi:hypothetical protein, partial [Sphingomonas sp. 10B4]|uniref:hypothetical protein n=1 Tax=Sphingomonas sp. 10B4 TaxID=3048575 RepID=UPI002B22497B
TYTVAFNLLSNTPKWMQSLNALPMYLGLDLRGGVHFLMQVDTKAVLNKRVQGLQSVTPASAAAATPWRSRFAMPPPV